MKLNTTVSRMWAKACLAAAAICVSATAFAAEEFPNNGTLQANTDYLLTGNVDLRAVYVPDQSGTIIYTQGNAVTPYHDANYEQVYAQDEYHFLSYLDQRYTIDVTEGEPVYFLCSALELAFGADGTIFRIDKDQPVEVVMYDTTPGTVIGTTSGFNEMTVTFNQPVTVESIVMSVDGTSTSAKISSSPVANINVFIPYVNTLKSWYNTGALVGGEDLTITLSGIKNAQGKEYKNGEDLVLHYKAAPKSTTLLSYKEPNPFMSYWKQGDPAAVMTVTYDGNISRADYELTFGNFEAEIPDGYYEVGGSDMADSPAKVTIENNVVKIDFAGYQRRPQDMVPSGTNYGNLVAKVFAYDEAGQPVQGSGQGQVGSFDVALNYVYITPAELRPIFTPAPGGTLNGEENLEIRLYDYDKIEFTGVQFEIEGANTIIVPKSDVTVKAGTNNDWTLIVPIPAEAKDNSKKVVVTLDGLISVDGVDHSNDIRAVYNGFTITTFEYYSANGQLITSRELPEFAADSKLQVLTNVSEQYPDMYMEYEVLRMVKDGEPESVKPASYMVRTTDPFDGSVIYTQEFPMSVKLVRNEEYHLVFTAYQDEMSRWMGVEPLGSEYVVFTGTTEPFRFSSIVLENVDPENGTEIEPDQTQFTLSFNGLVKMDGQSSYITYGGGVETPFASIEPIDSEDGVYANTWTVTIPDWYIASFKAEFLSMCIIATDENGYLVEGNEGFEEGSYIRLEYPVAGVGENSDFYVTPAEGEVESLLNFEVGCPNEATGLTWNDDLAIELVNRADRQLIQQFTMSDMQVVALDQEGNDLPADCDPSEIKTTVVRFSLNSEVTEAGVYLLTIPKGFFQFGEQFTTTVNSATDIAYNIIGGETPEADYTVTPEPGAVTELSEIVLDFAEGPMLSEGFPTLKIDDNEPIRLDDPMVEYPEDWLDPSCKYIQTLPQTYTEKGVYVITYPYGYFNNFMGEPLAAIELTYMIGTTGIEAVYGDVENINAYTLDGRQVIANGNADDVKALAPGYYVINGKKVVITK